MECVMLDQVSSFAVVGYMVGFVTSLSLGLLMVDEWFRPRQAADIRVEEGDDG